MNDNLVIYLTTRNFLTNLSILLLGAFTLGIILIIIYFLSPTGGLTLPVISVLVPLPFVLFLGLKNNFSSFESIPQMGNQMYGPDYVRIKPFIEIIRKSIGLKTPVRVYPDHEGKTGVRTYAKVAHLFIAKADTRKPEPLLIAILTHELIHIMNNDSLKRGIIRTLGYILAIYSAILILLLLQNIPFFLFMILAGAIGLIGSYLYFLPNRIMEKTADGATVYLGCAEGMMSFLNLLEEPPLFFNTFTVHDSPRSRIANIQEIIGD